MPELEQLIGTKIERIFFNEDYLKLITDKGSFVFTVDADCCSRSIFYDFVGVEKLLKNGEVIEVGSIELEPDDISSAGGGMKDKKGEDDDIKVYGYKLVTVDPIFGPVTSVFSFRNYSNGYYGGELVSYTGDREVSPEIFEDVIETQEDNIYNGE